MSGNALQWSTHIFYALSLQFCVPCLLSRLLSEVKKIVAKLLNNKGITFFWNVEYFSLFIMYTLHCAVSVPYTSATTRNNVETSQETTQAQPTPRSLLTNNSKPTAFRKKEPTHIK
jgi:hypothetical protein